MAHGVVHKYLLVVDEGAPPPSLPLAQPSLLPEAHGLEEAVAAEVVHDGGLRHPVWGGRTRATHLHSIKDREIPPVRVNIQFGADGRARYIIYTASRIEKSHRFKRASSFGMDGRAKETWNQLKDKLPFLS